MREASETTGLHKPDASGIRDPEVLERARDIQFWLAANLGSLILLTVFVMVIFPALMISEVMRPRTYPQILVGVFWFVPYIFFRWLMVSRIRKTSMLFLKTVFSYDLLASGVVIGCISDEYLNYLSQIRLLEVVMIITALAWPFVIIWNLFSLGKRRVRGIEIRTLIYFPLFIFEWVVLYDYAYHHGWMLSLHGLVHGVD